MRWAKGSATFIFAMLYLLLYSNTSYASYESAPDYSNGRVVPLMSSPNDLNSNGSGFLYSSRIVFTSGHTAFSFNSNGERQEFRPDLAVGKPNVDIKTIDSGVRVIKRISAPKYLGNDSPDLHDFAILILEKDLIPAEPVQLLTPEIEQILLEKRAEVKIHGYGNTVDLCGLGESLPCKTNRPKASDVPRSITATLRPATDFPTLVGYQVPKRLLEQLLFFTPGKSSMCGGDSGGSLTTTFNGNIMYLANIGTADRIYACGQSPSFDGKGGINYSQPIYRYLDLIKEAETFVATQIALEKAEAKAAAELKAKQEAEAKAATEKLIADAKAAADKLAAERLIADVKTEAERILAAAKAAVTKKTTITCVKGKLTKKVTAVKPVCPKGYKKK